MRLRWNPFKPVPKRDREITFSKKYRRLSLKDRPKEVTDLWRLVKEYISPYWLKMSLGLLVNTMAAVTPFAFGYTNRMVVDDALELGRWGEGGVDFINQAPELLQEKTLLLLFILSLIVSIHILSMAGSWVFNYTAVFVSQRIVYTMRQQLYHKLQQLQMTFFDQRITGKIMARVLDDVSAIQHHITATFSNIITNVMMFVIGMGVLFSIDVKLATIAVITVPSWAIIYHFFGKKIGQNARKIREKNSEIYGVVEEKISAIRVVKAFAREPLEVKRYVHLAADFVRLSLRQAKLSQGLSMGAGIMSVVGTGLILYLGALDVKEGIQSIQVALTGPDPLFTQYTMLYFEQMGITKLYDAGVGITPGNLLYFYGSVASLYAPIMVIMNLNAMFQWVLVVLRRVFEVLDEPVEIGDKEDAVEMPPIKGEVVFEDVCLKYPNASVNALDKIDLTIPAGSNVAIMGQSGAGKSSMVNLLMRFYEVTGGRILVDGHDLRDVTLKSLRRHISMVPQEITMFTGTIAENIKYGRTEALATQVIRAAEEAELHPFIMALPEKYETQVGEHGTKLSGGQRQRLAIAMSLLTDPRVLILDDSTSALDAQTEERIRNTLKEIMKNRTSFIITHRIATARDADIILVLEEGKLVEQGTHEELIEKKDGAYSRIVELQQRGASLIDDPEDD